MAENKLAPEIVAIVLCERLITDAATGDRSAISILSIIRTNVMPFCLQKAYAYAVITSIHRPFKIIFRVVRDSDGRVMLQSGEAEVNVSDPLAHGHVSAELKPLCFESPGQYALELLADGDMVARWRFVVQVGA